MEYLEDLADKIVRSRRRTLALIITEDASLEIRAPFKASFSSIKKFVHKNRAWIDKKIKEKKDFYDKYRHYTLPEKFVNGAGVMYEGNIYKLQIVDSNNISLSGGLYFPKKFLPQARQYLIIWLKHQAFKKIIERVDYFANIAKLQYKSIKITSAKGIWGSCSNKGSLIINWRLIMAPSTILDYIVVHEIAHLAARNHSRLFWSRVEKILPDYKKHEAWVKNNGDILML